MSTAVVRRFGTDVSNLPKEELYKTPKKASSSTLSGFENAKPFVPNFTSTQLSAPVDDISLDDEIFLTSPSKRGAEYCRYERDFLLSMQKFCIQPLEGLIPEVLPGYTPIEEISPMKSTRSSGRFTPRTPTSTDDQVTPFGGVTFKAYKSPATSSNPSSKDPTSSPSKSSPLKRNLSIEIPPVSSFETTPLKSNTYSPSSPISPSAFTNAISPTNLVMEWRAKKASTKKSKPREADARRLAARQKQIDIGMNTPGYKRFLELVPVEQRTKDHPRIPDIFQICSKRSWDGQVRKWRRQLHQYDPNELAGQTTDDCKGDEIEDFGEDAVSDEEYSSECEDEHSEQTEASEHTA